MKNVTIAEILSVVKLPEGIENPDCDDIKQQVNWFNVNTDELLSEFNIVVPCGIKERISKDVDKHVRLVQIIKSQCKGVCISYNAIVFKGKIIGTLQTLVFDNDSSDRIYMFVNEQALNNLQNYLIELIINAYKTTNQNIFDSSIIKGETLTKDALYDIYYIKPEVLELLKGN